MVIPADEPDNNDFSPSTATSPTSKRRDSAMEVGAQKSRRSSWSRLHNFSSLPSFNLEWGTHRYLRCVKDPELTHPESNLESRKRRRSSSSPDDGGIDAVRQKLMLDLRAEVRQMKEAFLNSGKDSAAADTAAQDTEAVETRPWNLRTRRAVCKDPNPVIDRKSSLSPAKSADVKSPVKNLHGNGETEVKGKRPKFAVSLSKKEIEEDFLALTGVRPARRPKKRAKCVQRQIDAMFPGLWLTEITADMYKVNERPSEDAKK